MSELPEYIEVINLGDEVQLSVRGVVGLCGLVHRIIATYDALLLKSIYAENELLARWMLRFGRTKPMLKSIKTDRDKQFKRYIIQSGFLDVDNIDDLLQWARAKQLVVYT